MKSIYCIYESKFIGDPDGAFMFTVENTLEQAKKLAPTYAEDAVIVEEVIKDNKIIKRKIIKWKDTENHKHLEK